MGMRGSKGGGSSPSDLPAQPPPTRAAVIAARARDESCCFDISGLLLSVRHPPVHPPESRSTDLADVANVARRASTRDCADLRPRRSAVRLLTPDGREARRVGGNSPR